MTIHAQENSKYLTDAQWLTLMSIVSGDKAMMLSMPMEEGCPANLTYDGKYYVIKADGSYDG